MYQTYFKQVVRVKSSLQNFQLSWSRLEEIKSPNSEWGNKLFKCITQDQPQDVTFKVMAQGIWMLPASKNTRESIWFMHP